MCPVLLSDINCAYRYSVVLLRKIIIIIIIIIIIEYFITCLQGSKFIFDFGSTCATRCKFLSALPKF